MLQILAVTCYLPNASFVYNPITKHGEFRATYIPDDQGTAYEICSKLDKRLARASIELANEQEAFSANYEYRHGLNVNIVIDFITIEQQEAGILTAQSNFKISMLDMDAEVKQTLAYFSVQSYNADDCLLNINNYIVQNRMIIRADQAGCNYDITKFGKKVSGLTPEQQNQTVIATISCFEMSVTMPVGIAFQALQPTDSFQIIFDCDAQKNRTECLNIIRNFTFQPMKTSKFELQFQLANPESDYLIIQNEISAIIDPENLDCYAQVQYQINGELVIFYLTPTGNCNFNTMLNQMTIGISDSLDDKIARQWIFNQRNFSFDSTTSKFSLECKTLEIDDCSALLTYLGRQESIYVTITFVYYVDEIQYFLVSYPERYQSCYEYIELTAKCENGADSGSISINNIVLNLPDCVLVNPNRILIQLDCYKKTVPDGYITEIEETPFLSLAQRDIFSTINQTIMFDNIQDLDMLAQLAGLMSTNSLYCVMQYDNLILPVVGYNDLTSIFDNIRIYLISILGGIFGGLIYAGIDIAITLNRYKTQKKDRIQESQKN